VAGSKRSQTYFVVQDSDTVALQTTPLDIDQSHPHCATSFGWQVRLTLGRKKVRDGLRQTFVQLSFAVDSPDRVQELGSAVVRTRWRRYDPKTGAVGQIISSSGDTISSRQSLPSYNLGPGTPVISWSDAGNGQIYIHANGIYPQGTAIAVGSKIWNSATPGFAIDDTDGIHFVAPALAFMMEEEAFIVAPGGDRNRLEHWVAKDKGGRPTEMEHLGISNATVTPSSDTDSWVTVCYSGGANDRVLASYGEIKGKDDRVLALIGGITFGLADKPVQHNVRSCPEPEHSLQFEAPTEALRSFPMVRLKQLFYGSYGSTISPLTFINDFSVSKLTILAKTEDCTLYAIQGNELGRYVEGHDEFEQAVEIKIANHVVQPGQMSKRVILQDRPLPRSPRNDLLL
jgi:hypothetical protein